MRRARVPAFLHLENPRQRDPEAIMTVVIPPLTSAKVMATPPSINAIAITRKDEVPRSTHLPPPSSRFYDLTLALGRLEVTGMNALTRRRRIMDLADGFRPACVTRGRRRA